MLRITLDDKQHGRAFLFFNTNLLIVYMLFINQLLRLVSLYLKNYRTSSKQLHKQSPQNSKKSLIHL